MLALSIRQPWAWAIIHAGKDIENRGRQLDHRGPLAVHAAQTFDEDGYRALPAILAQAGLDPEDLPEPRQFERGGIIGTVVMVNCVRSHPSVWFRGRWGYVLERPRTVRFMPCRGQLYPFEVALGDPPSPTFGGDTPGLFGGGRS